MVTLHVRIEGIGSQFFSSYFSANIDFRYIVDAEVLMQFIINDILLTLAYPQLQERL